MNTLQTSYATQFTPEQSSPEDKTETPTENNNTDAISSIWTKDRFNEEKIAKHELTLNMQNSQMSWLSQENNNREEMVEPMEEMDEEEKEGENNEVAMVTVVENEQNSPAHHARRPMNAFLIFCKKHRPIVRKKYPNYENRSVTKILGEWWALLDEVDKKPYVDLAKEHKDAFFTANPNFKWYKLPAPPLRTLTTRPGSVQKEPIIAQSPPLQCSQHESEFTPGKLADESQLGNLTSLMQTTYAKVSESDDKSKDFPMNNNNNDDVVSEKLLESPPNVVREVTMPSKPIKKRKIENVENDSKGIARDIFDCKNSVGNGKITNRELMDKVVDNMFINYTPQNGGGRDISPRKSERSCKGLKYIEFMANGKLIKNKREKPEIALSKIENEKSEPKIEYLQNTINKLAERTNRTNIREVPTQETQKRVYTNSESSEENFPKNDFNLDRRISDLPTLEYDTYMQRKRESKRRKLPKAKPKVHDAASTNNNNNNNLLIGSQKRKNKRSITHLETNRDVQPTDLSGLATLAEIAANSQKIN